MRTKTHPDNVIPSILLTCEEHSSKPVEQWNHWHLLGHWLAITGSALSPVPVVPGYENKRQEPSRHPALENMRNIFRAFGNNPSETRDYLDWLKEKGFKVPQKDIVTLTRFRTRNEQAKIKRLLQKGHVKCEPTIGRATPLPEDLQSRYQVSSYGDLAFMIQMDPLPDHLMDIPDDLKDTLRRVV